MLLALQVPCTSTHSHYSRDHTILQQTQSLQQRSQHFRVATNRLQAEEGCKVCVLIWDDRTSKKVMGLSGGMLHTHDEETHAYFQGTNVSVGKSLRCLPPSVRHCTASSDHLYLSQICT
jgi:hypothetical protein